MPSVKPRRGRRWLVRLAGTVIASLLLLAGIWWWYRPTLTGLAIELANRALPDFHLAAERVEQRSAEELVIHRLQVQLRSDASEIVVLDRVTVRTTWRELLARRIREVRLDAPNLRVTDALLGVIATLGGGEAASAPWSIDRLQIERGQLGVRLAGLPQIAVSLEAELTGLSSGGRGDEAKQQVRLRDLRVQAAAEPMPDLLRIPEVGLTFTWREVFESQRLARVRIERPSVRYERAAIETLPRPSTTAPDSPAGVWRIGELSISDARVRLDDLGPHTPVVAFGADAELREVPLGRDPEPDAEQLQSVTLRAIEARVPGGAGEPFVRVPNLRAHFRWREMLADRWIHSVDVERPRILWSGALQRAFTGPASAAIAEEKTPPFRIGVLQVSRASCEVESLAPGWPAARWEMDAGMTEVPLGAPAGELPAAEQALAIHRLALKVGDVDFLEVPAIYSTFSWHGLLAERRLGLIRIEQPELRFDPAISRALDRGETAPPAAAGAPQQPWRVDELSLFDGQVALRDLGLGLPPIQFGVTTTFRDLGLSLEGEALRDTVQTVELHHLSLQSPLDPFTSVLKLPTLFVRFTPAGIWRRQIERVEVINPILNIGEDLFWYVDRLQTRDSAAAADLAPRSAERSWTINRFDVTAGQLVLAFDGKPRLPLPLPFETSARNLNFSRLSELRLTLDLTVPEQDYVYPDYGLTLRGVSGRLQFSLPPERRANNLVQTLKVAEMRWKDYQARDLFVDLTFDEKAIHGRLGGRAYRGYVQGAFEFGLDASSSWSGWVSGAKVDLRQFTDAFSPEKLSLTGPANFSANVRAQGREIERFDGDFRALGRGEMHIGKLNEIIRELPPEWEPLKRAATRIGLETIRDFAYDTAHGDFRFNGRSGRASLDLRGPGGSRRVDAQVYDRRDAASAVEVTVR